MKLTFGQLILLEWRKRTGENERLSENKLNSVLNEVDSEIIKKAAAEQKCELPQLVDKILFDGIKEAKLPYNHTAILSMWGDEYCFVISPSRAREIIQDYYSQNGKLETKQLATKFTAQLYLAYKFNMSRSQQ